MVSLTSIQIFHLICVHLISSLAFSPSSLLNCVHVRRRVQPLSDTSSTASILTNKNNTQQTLNDEQKQFFSSLSSDIYGSAFIDKLLDLQIYINEHGNTLVPKRYAKNPSLGNWVNKTRQMYRKYKQGEASSMNQMRIQILNEMGFQWDGNAVYEQTSFPIMELYDASSLSSNPSSLEEYDTGDRIGSNEKFSGRLMSPKDRQWMRNFYAYKTSREKEGDNQISSKSSLGIWASRQRREYRAYQLGEKSSMTQHRIMLLNDIHFDWDPKDTKWKMRVQELLSYKKKFGNCLVPAQYDENPALGRWVSTQRKYYKLWKQGKATRISLERIQELTRIGFVWDRWEDHWNGVFK